MTNIRRFTPLLGALALLPFTLIGCGGGTPSGNPTPTPTPTPTVPPPPGGARSVLVRLPAGTDRAALERDLGVRFEAGPDDDLWRVPLDDDDDEDEVERRLSGDARVSGAERDQTLQSPEVHGSPIHQAFDVRVRGLGEPDADFENQAAWSQVNLAAAQSVTRGAGITIAVLDTGVEAGHPALAGRLLAGYNVLSPASVPADAADGKLNNVVGHGTMVAGVLARIAPDAKILPVRVLDGDGVGSTAGVLEGLRWAISHGASVVNLSLGSQTPSRFLKDAIDVAKQKGVVVVAAAGNSGVEKVDYPAVESSVLCVTALDATRRRASFANYGSAVDLSAPGTGIRSSFGPASYASWSGTSFAAPFAAGAAALLRATDPTLRADDVIDRLEDAASDIDTQNPGLDGRLGKGLLDIGNAVTTSGRRGGDR